MMGFGRHTVKYLEYIQPPFQTCLWVSSNNKHFSIGTADKPLLELLQSLKFRGTFKKYQFFTRSNRPPPRPHQYKRIIMGSYRAKMVPFTSFDLYKALVFVRVSGCLHVTLITQLYRVRVESQRYR